MELKYIINVSFIVEPVAHGQWYEFFTTKFIPELRGHGYGELIFTRVLTDEANSHYTYSLQVKDSTVADYQRFMSEMMAEYSKIAEPWFAQKVLHYTSLLKIIEIE